jgi:hypothetical protein
MKDMRGFLLQEAGVCLERLEDNDGSASGSSYTQTGGRPGAPVPSDPLGAFLPRVSHAQAADIDVIALRPGAPGGSASLGYRVSGEANTSYRGWNEPNLVLGYRPVEWSSANNYNYADCVVCPGSQKVVAVAAEAAANHPVSAWVWDPAARAWSARAEPDATATGTVCCVTVLRQTGRLLLFIGSSSDGTAAVYASDDDGDNWEEYAPFAMRAGTLNSSVDQVRWVQDRYGNLSLFALVSTTGAYWQYVSIDGGCSFTELESGASTMRSLSMAMLPGSIDPASPLLVVYASNTSAATSRALADAHSLFSDAAANAVDGVNTVQGVQVALDADGAVYALLSVLSSDQVKVAFSLDGESWSVYTQKLLQLGGSVASPTNHQHYIRCCAWSGGELVALFASGHSTAPSTDGSLISLWCGGWSNVEGADTAGTRLSREGWGNSSVADRYGVFLPTEMLVSQGWSHTGTAASVQSGYLVYNVAAATGFDRLNTAGHSSGAHTILFEAQVVSGGQLAGDDCSFYHERRNGALSRKLTIRMNTTGFRVRDTSGAGTTLVDIDADMTTLMQFAIVYSSTSSVVVLYKRPESSVWEAAVSATLGSDATGFATDIYEVGARAATTSQMRVGMIAFGNHRLLRTLSGSARLRWGKNTKPTPYPVRDQVDTDARVLHLSGAGGVASYQETWEIPAVWDHGVREADVVKSPKPTATWRSEDTSEQILCWDLGADSRLGTGWAIGMCLVRPNFRLAYLEVSTDAAPNTFTTIGTYDARVVTSGSFMRSGRLVRPSSSTTRDGWFFGAAQLRRGVATLDPTGTPKLRRILRNEGGGWQGAGMRTHLELDGVDGTELTSGSLHVDACGGVLVVHQSAPTTYRRVRLRIPAQSCVDDYFELGGIVLGSIWVIGQQWSRGWSSRWVPRTRVEEDEEGTTFVEPIDEDDDVLKREITVAWQDGFGDAAIRAGMARALAVNGTALAADQDVWRQIVGLVKESQGGKLPCVAILEIPQGTAMITDPSMWSYGRLAVGQSPQFNHVQGREGRGEIYRGESLTHVEL